MNLEYFRSLCADPAKTDQDVLIHIMELKRIHGTLPDPDKDEMCGILRQSHRDDLANKIYRSLERHRQRR